MGDRGLKQPRLCVAAKTASATQGRTTKQEKQALVAERATGR
jgi:hypothetical protein